MPASENVGTPEDDPHRSVPRVSPAEAVMQGPTEPPPEPAADERDAPGTPPDELSLRWSAAVQDAVYAGLRYCPRYAPHPPADRSWQRLSCAGCGDRLDLPPAEEPRWARYGRRAVYRVVAFTHLHRGHVHPSGGAER